jgi:hypothetical protein
MVSSKVEEKRKFPRYVSLAQALVKGFLGEAVVRDLSITGIRLEFSVAIALPLEEKYVIVIYPETSAQISPFEILAQPMWNRAIDNSFEIGFKIIESPKGKQFFNYIEYLAWKVAHH